MTGALSLRVAPSVKDIQNKKTAVFLHFHKLFESHFQKSKNNSVEILAGGCLFLKSFITLKL